MYCLIRVNAHPSLGNGHLMRCLTLARIACAQGFKALFIVGDYPATPVQFIAAAGFNYVLVPVTEELQDAHNVCELINDMDAPCRVVVDVYAFGAAWQQQIYAHCEQLMVIDDLANRPHYCDQLLDHTPGRKPCDYAPWVNPSASLYLGCEHALLAAEFFATVDEAKHQRADYCAQQRLPKLLVSLGGTDPNELSLVWFDLLAPHAHQFAGITFLLASNAVGLDQLASKIANFKQASSGIELVVDAKAMPQLLLNHDLAIGGAGVSALERAVVGLPSLMLTLADNQLKQAQALIEANCVIALGDWQQRPSHGAQQKALKTLLEFKQDYAHYQRLSANAFNLVARSEPYRAIFDFLTNHRVETR